MFGEWEHGPSQTLRCAFPFSQNWLLRCVSCLIKFFNDLVFQTLSCSRVVSDIFQIFWRTDPFDRLALPIRHMKMVSYSSYFSVNTCRKAVISIGTKTWFFLQNLAPERGRPFLAGHFVVENFVAASFRFTTFRRRDQWGIYPYLWGFVVSNILLGTQRSLIQLCLTAGGGRPFVPPLKFASGRDN